MKHYSGKPTLLVAAVLAALGSGYAKPVVAQEESIEEVVVTGTRSRPRSVTESMVPIDVISADDFRNQGDSDLSSLLRTVVPSYSVNTQPISDAATIVRPANLRGLAPDHTLVLVNGKRRHRAAVIYWLGNGVADGAQGPDISAIPAIALKQVEVLRDGASAQYGSDAIAGVMNFLLRDDNNGATIQAKYGTYYEGDGDLLTVSGNIGLPLTQNGFANLSFEYGEVDATDRSVQRNDAAALIAAGNSAVGNPAQVWGSPEISDEIKLWGNFGIDLEGGTQLYSHANYVTKTVEGGFYFRNPTNRGAVYQGPEVDATTGAALAGGVPSVLVGDVDGIGVGGACPAGIPLTGTNGLIPDATILAQVTGDANCFSFVELFPGGFTPRFGGDVEDIAVQFGVRGETTGGLLWDASIGYGSNEVDFFINNTVNASLGPNTPVNFDPGLYKQTDLNLNFDVSYALSDSLNLAGGVEYRDEEFEIGIGQVESYQIGPLADQGFSAASNGFPGFGDIAAGSWSRSNYALYGDVEWSPRDQWTIGVAGRWEDFDDFGTTTNFKVSTNYRFSDTFAARASWSTGFRAPTPGQSNAFNVSTEFDLALGDLVNNGTIPSSNPVAALRGGVPLEPEESRNMSAGVIFDVGPISITADYFNVEVTDRLSVSQNFSLSPAEVADLVASGVTSAGNLQNFRFFTNDFDTETQGIDVVATTSADILGGTTDITFSYNHTNTSVKSFNPVTLDQTRIRELQEGLPDTRYNLTANHFVGDWRFLARVSFFDEWFDSEDGNVYEGEYLVDAEAAYQINDAMNIVVGAQNIFDQFPEENPGARDGVGNRYSQFSPFGFNGGFWYVRFNYDFN